MKFIRVALIFAAGLLVPAMASAGTICPSFPGDPIHGSTGCNTIITINANGTLSISYPDPNQPYDGHGDDNLVGVINDSGSAVSSILLSSSTDIFGFDGDGIDKYLHIHDNSHDNTGYGGVDAYFTDINHSKTSGTVDFINAILGDGGTGYFSLEGSPDCDDLHGKVGNPTPAPVPEPSSLLLLGTGALGVAGSLRRRFAK